jgi:hypothetical protein
VVILQTQLRLLILTSLLLCATVLVGIERASTANAIDSSLVFVEPPAYLHPPSVLGFDVSGIHSAGRTEAELRWEVQSARDAEARAQAHLSLAVYYKMRGLGKEASAERRKAEYWRRLERNVPAVEP